MKGAGQGSNPHNKKAVELWAQESDHGKIIDAIQEVDDTASTRIIYNFVDGLPDELLEPPIDDHLSDIVDRYLDRD